MSHLKVNALNRYNNKNGVNINVSETDIKVVLELLQVLDGDVLVMGRLLRVVVVATDNVALLLVATDASVTSRRRPGRVVNFPLRRLSLALLWKDVVLEAVHAGRRSTRRSRSRAGNRRSESSLTGLGRAGSRGMVMALLSVVLNGTGQVFLGHCITVIAYESRR